MNALILQACDFCGLGQREIQAPRTGTSSSALPASLRTYRRIIDFCCVTSDITADRLSRLFPLAFFPPPNGNSAARKPPDALIATCPVDNPLAILKATFISLVMTPEPRPYREL